MYSNLRERDSNASPLKQHICNYCCNFQVKTEIGGLCIFINDVGDIIEHDLRHASWGGCESDGQQALC